MTTVIRRPRRGLAIALGAVALSAYGGVLGLLTGAIDVGPEITPRLPFDSPLLAGLALLLVVALPTTLAAIAAWQGVPETGTVVAAAGLLLVGWIVVQVVVIQAFSWFQPAYGLVGAAMLVGGLWLRRRDAEAAAQRSRVTT